MTREKGAGKGGLIFFGDLGAEAEVSFHLENPGTQVVLLGS